MKKFSEWIGAIREAENLKEESDKQAAYQEFFMKKLKEFGVTSPAELDDDKKKKFFDEISSEWDSEKGAANEGEVVSEENTCDCGSAGCKCNEEEVKAEEPSDEEDPKEEVASESKEEEEKEEEASEEEEDDKKEDEPIDEASVQVAGKNKPSGAKVLATVIIEHMMKENYLKPGADAAKDALISDIAKVIMDSTF